MIYKINILAQADKDLAWFRKHDRKSYVKCFDLVRDVAKDARIGIGKPERLKYFDEEVYSRRVNRKDRMVYIIYEETKRIDISSFREHYE
ncbi:MAG: Txe/YoeB family addiction module toxin [Ardenticatenaceae bacterium]